MRRKIVIPTVVMIAAGLVARKAVERGLTTKPWVKTSLAPGSKVVMDYLSEAGLLPALEALKFILFVNQPKLLSETYGRYLEGRIRAAERYPGLPVLLSCRARSENV